MQWDFEGTFLDQFPASYRGAVGDQFCKVIRAGAETPQEVLTAVCEKQTRYGQPTELGQMILRGGVLASEGAYEFAEFLLEREALPPDVRHKLKEESRLKNALQYAKPTMAEQPPTWRQLNYLESLGCKEVPKSKLEASELIDKYLKARKAA